MSKCGSSCCGKPTDINETRSTTNIAPRVVKAKENIIQERRSCGCVKTTNEIKPTTLNQRPRRSSIITQCSVTRSQTKATISAIDNRTKGVSRPPLALLKGEKPGNVQTTAQKSSSGAVKKVATKPTTNVIPKRTTAPLAVSTVKRNPTRTSTGALPSTQINSSSSTSNTSKPTIKKTRSTGTLPSSTLKPKAPVPKTQLTKPPKTSLPSSTLITSTVASKKSSKYNCPQKSTTITTQKLPTIQKSLKAINEEKTLSIPPKQKLELTVNTTRGFDCGSPILDVSFHTPIADETTWRTFKTNTTNNCSLLPYKEENYAKNTDNDDSGFSLDSVAIQIVIDGIPSLKKKTLKRQLSVSSGYRGVINLDPYTNKVHPAILYSDYMIDVVRNILEKEQKLKLNKDFMKKSKILPIYRTAIINWLIKLHQYVNSDANVFFLCVRIFDKLLSTIEIPQELLQLTGMIAYWIAHKYGDSVEHLTLRKLQELSRNRYTAKLILSYERKILNSLKYDISIEEPVIFVRYYIYILQIEDSNDVSFCANYLLDCLTTSWDINTFPLSLQASAAVFLSLQFLGHNINIWNVMEAFPGYYSIDDMFSVTERILERLLLVQNENYEFREIYHKYACEKYNYMSFKVTEGIRNLKK